MNMMKKYVWIFMAMILPWGFVACSDDEDPIKEPEVLIPSDDEKENDVAKPDYYTLTEAYINQFCYDQMSYYYLWWEDIDVSNWRLDDKPVEKVNSIRYEEDRWSMAIENIKPYTDSSVTTSGTYGYDYKPYWADESQKNVVAVVTLVYPGSPAEKAGLKRGSVIKKMNGRDIENKNEDYNTLLSSASIDLSVFDPESSTNKEIKMGSVDMYLEPVLYERTFDCGGKKVGYVFFNDFSMDCNDRLIEVAKKFKQEGVSELVLDLRYNSGGYVVTEELLASLLAPESSVKSGDLYQTAVYNDTEYSKALKKYYGADYSNTYFNTKHEWTYGGKKFSYDTSDANIGLTKIYGLVSSSTASASEAILVSLMPYVDVEIIGTKTQGKHCSGLMFEAEEYYQDYESYMENLKKSNKGDYDQLMNGFWKYFSGWKNYVGNWGLYVMVSTYADKDGNNACRPNGLIPDKENADNPIEPYQLGDDREALLRAALTEAGYTHLTPLPETESRVFVGECLGKLIKVKSEGKRILLNTEKPKVFRSRSLSIE